MFSFVDIENQSNFKTHQTQILSLSSWEGVTESCSTNHSLTFSLMSDGPHYMVVPSSQSPNGSHQFEISSKSTFEHITSGHDMWHMRICGMSYEV